jgi:HSP20 family molecular chaperone IbpA
MSDMLYNDGVEELYLKVEATQDGIKIKAEGENGDEEAEFSWSEIIEAMIRVSGRL